MIENEIFEIDHKYFRWGQEEFEIFANAVWSSLSISVTRLRTNISGQTIESFYSLYICKIKFNFCEFFCLQISLQRIQLLCWVVVAADFSFLQWIKWFSGHKWDTEKGQYIRISSLTGDGIETLGRGLEGWRSTACWPLWTHHTSHVHTDHHLWWPMLYFSHSFSFWKFLSFTFCMITY